MSYEAFVETPEFGVVRQAEIDNDGILVSLGILGIPGSALAHHPLVRLESCTHAAFESFEEALTALVEVYDGCGQGAVAKVLDDCLDTMIRRARLNDAIDELDEMGLV